MNTQNGLTYNLALGEISSELFDEKPLSGRTYAPPGGLPLLVQKIALSEGVPVDRVCITTGASMALTATLASLEGAGEVLCPKPFYPAYPKMIASMGLQPVFYNVKADEQGCISEQHLQKLVTPNCKAIIINSPGNPLGNTLKKADFVQINEVARDNELLIICDEVYAPFTYKKQQNHEQLLMSDKLVRIKSLSKQFGFPGERIGYAIAQPFILDRIRRFHWALAMNAPYTGQLLAYKALQEESDYNVVFRRLKENLQVAVETLQMFPEIDFILPEGGFFIWLTFPALKCGFSDIEKILSKSDLYVMLGDKFGSDQLSCRVSFACAPDIVKPSLTRLGNIINLLS